MLRDPVTAEPARAALVRGDAARVGLGRAPRGAGAEALARALRSPLLADTPRDGVRALLGAIDGPQPEGEAAAALVRLALVFPRAGAMRVASRPPDGAAAEDRAFALAVGGMDLHASIFLPLLRALREGDAEREALEAEALAAQERVWAATYGPPAREPGEDLGAGELRTLLRDAEGQWQADRAVPSGPLRLIVSRYPPIGMGAVRWWRGRLSFPSEVWIMDAAGTRVAPAAEAEALSEAEDRRPGRCEDYNASMSYRITPIAGTPYVLREFQAGPIMGRGDVVRVDRAGGTLYTRLS